MNSKKHWLNKSFLQILLTIIGSVFYLYLALWLQMHSAQIESHYILGISIPCAIANGVVTQIQMLIVVVLVLLGGKSSYITALCLNSLSLLSSFMYAVRSSSASSAPGILSYVGVTIIILLIRSYKRRIKDQVSILRNQEDELKELAYYDGLTGVLNRKSFIDELDQQILFSTSHNRKLHVIFIDIDDFKQVNDTLGHHAGDYVLQQLAIRIKKELHASDIIGRLGGDEIGLIIRNDVDDKRIRACLKAIHARAVLPYDMNEQKITATVSIGASAFPADGDTSEELLKKADIAMYQAKINGKSRVLLFGDLDADDIDKTIAGGKGSYGARPSYSKS